MTAGPRTRLVSAVYTALVTRTRLSEHARLGPYWRRAWDWTARQRGVVIETTVHGRPWRLLPGGVYPVYMRRWPTYNDPVVELVHLASVAAGGPADVVDVGAALGDTALLLRASCRGELGRVVSVEGDPAFAALARRNMAWDPQTTVVEALLSDGSPIRSLVVSPTGTATAAGDEIVAARPLDDVLAEAVPGFRPHVLKDDTDGSDGRVLAGARRLLAEARPAVLFEWDPGSFERLGADWLQPFEVLDEAGYAEYVWFDKYGAFSHFMPGYDEAAVRVHAAFCKASRSRPEWHYDVVALHPDSGIDPVELADLRWVRAHKAAP